MKRLILALLFLSFSISVNATTYYVCETATGDESGDSFANCMDVADHNAGSFSGDDIIYLCDTLTSAIIFPSSGTSGHPIIYRGDYSGHPCVYDGSGINNAFKGTDINYITIRNLTIENTIQTGILCNTTDNDGSVTRGWTMEYLTISGTGQNGIAFYGAYNTITNCHITDAGYDGIYARGNNATFTYNYIKNPGVNDRGDCIQFSTYLADFYVAYNYLENMRVNAKQVFIAAEGSTDGGIFEHNYCKLTTDLTYSRYVVQSTRPNTTIRYNTMIGGLYSFSGDGCVMHHNIMRDATGVGVRVQDNGQSIWIYNNTIVNCDKGIYHDTDNPVILTNNIIYNNGTYGVYAAGDGASAITHTYNYVSGNGTDFFGISKDATEQTDDPVLENSTHLFELQSTSPCINAGTDLSYTVDFNGTAIDSSPDIGAFEYKAYTSRGAGS